MKYLQILTILFAICGCLFQAQAQNPCGTVMSQEQIDWLRDFKQNPPTNFKKSNQTIYLPIQFHSVGTTEGEGHFTKIQILQVMCDLNDNYANTGSNFQFFLHNNEIKYINNSNYYEHEFNAGAQMMNQNNVYGAVNVYMVADPAGNCGYFAPGPDGVAVAKSCAGAQASTLTHELGHFFALPHTFYGWEYVAEGQELPVSQRERMARTGPTKNCHNTADFFCDTYSDYTPYRWPCPMQDDFVDPDGVVFKPDGSWYMSYSSDGCQSRFSPEQMEAMEANLYFQRDELLNNTPALNFEEIYACNIQYPAYPAQNIPYQNAYLQWSAVEGINSYALRVYNFAGYNLDVFVDENYYTVTDLEPNTTYYWEIVPYNDGNYCVNVDLFNSFKTSEVSTFVPSTADIVQPLCHGDETGSIYVEMSGGTAPYIYVWEDGTEGQNFIDLGAGKYTLTVTDATGITEDMNFEIGQPDALTVIVQQNGEEARAFVGGGREPYNYAWSDGTSSTVVTLLGGNHELIVTDANDCQVTVNFNMLTVVTDVNNINCKGTESGGINITETNGGDGIYTYDWNNGANSALLENVGAGVYEVTIKEEGNDDFEAVFSFEITEPEIALEGNVTINGYEASCTVISSDGPYEILWSNGSTENFATELVVGVDSLAISDGNGCTIMIPYKVIGLEGNITDACQGGATGSINLTVLGAEVPYYFEWDNDATTQNLNNLEAGTYTVTITDATDTQNTFTFNIEEPAVPLEIEVDFDPGLLEATASAEGGVEPYEFTWSHEETGEVVTDLLPANYVVTVTDANGCEATYSFEVEEGPVGINDIAQSNVQLYPNPVSLGQNMQIQLMFDKAEDVAIQVYNSAGQLIQQQTNEVQAGLQSINVPTHNWSVGLYFVEVKVGESLISRKLIVD